MKPLDHRLRGAACIALLAAVCWVGISGAAASAEPAWRTVQVPGTWEERAAEPPADAGLAKYDGFAWYRCRVRVPAKWITGKLYSDSLVLSVTQVADAHEVYLDGERIGSAGSFPPQFQSGLATVRRYKVLPTQLRKDADVVVAVRIYNQQGGGGFRGPAPVLGSYEHEINLRGTWEFRTGDDPAWAKAAAAEIAEAARFDRVEEASSPYRPTEETVPGDRLPPAEALAKLTAGAELAVDQVLTEPLVEQPVFLHFDERGRMWTVQYRQYPYPAGLEMVSRNKYYRAVYDKIPPPPPHHVRGRDRVTIHEDSDGDGRFDVHKTFVDGLNIATSALPGRGGVWILNPPYLLFYPDKNGDDVPDGDPEVHLSGFGLEDTHSATNSLSWGPDGWLYSTQGSNTVAHVRLWKEGVEGKVAARMDGAGVWRYHPGMRKFEVFAEGGGNAFALEIDSLGRIYSGHNGGDTRGFHYLQGGYYAKGTESKFMPVSNPYVFGVLPAMEHGKAVRFTHGFVRVEGSAMPAAYQDRLLCIDPLNNLVTNTEAFSRGSTFATRDAAPALASTDRAFRPVAIAAGPDGAVYVADFYEYYIAHGQHFQGQIDPSTGRVYRLRGKDFPASKAPDLGKLSSKQLVDLLSHPDRWRRRTALRLLADRQDVSVLPQLRKLLAESQGQSALEALWAIHLLGGFDGETFEAALDHPYFGVRTWGVRLLGDARIASGRQVARMAALAETEPNFEVLAQLAASARRLPPQAALPIAAALARRPEAALREDACFPWMLWWLFEGLCGSAPKEIEGFFQSPAVWEQPLVRTRLAGSVMRRFASLNTREGFLTCSRLLGKAPTAADVEALMAGFDAAFTGRSFGSLPPELVAALARTKWGNTLSVRLRLAAPGAMDEAISLVHNTTAPAPARRELVELLGEMKAKPALPVLLGLLANPTPDEVRFAALTAVQSSDDDRVAEAVLAQLAAKSFPPDLAAAAHTTLASRAKWAKRLVEAAREGRIAKETVAEETVAALRSRAELAAEVKAVWPLRDAVGKDALREQARQLGERIRRGTGNAYAGRTLFETSCGKCHQLFARGGAIGPDLTPLKRDDLDVLLLNIVNPSIEIREGFQSYTAATVDGRVLTGFLVDQDPQSVALRTQDGQTIRFDREDLEELTPAPRSLMPERLLESYSDQQLRDLFAYLRSSQPGR